MAAYGERNDPRANGIPWKYYGVVPNQNSEPKASEQELQAYNSSPSAQFGEWIFEHVCLDFLPDIVCDIRDFWMLEFAERSPFRQYFKWAVMPTVDARPQARQWVATYASADACLTYSDWAGGILEDQSGGKINYLGSAPPSAHPAYKPVEDKRVHKQFMGLDPDCKIIGTVMRNQRRKLYPDLFKAFKIFLSKVEDSSKYFLYCHTSYPDLGWDIPELLNEHGIGSKVLFTYICPETKKPFVSVFKGAVAQSPYTGKWGSTLSNVKNGLSYEDLSSIVNCFDLYTQYANCEGFGLPQVEAAACGVPVCGTDYSAMESVLRKLEGFTITPAALYKELETGCFRAVPDNEYASEIFFHFFEKMSEEDRISMGKRTRENFEKHYQWHLSGAQWEKYFDSFETLPIEQTWGSQPKIEQPSQKLDLEKIGNVSHIQLAKHLIVDVLREPEKLNTFFESRLTRDLLYKQATASTGGMYFNESSAAFDGMNKRQPFNYDIAYDQMAGICNRRNQWEKKRIQRIKELANVQQPS
jgi:glycosyltransferase involved in cell wall biosynthesis